MFDYLNRLKPRNQAQIEAQVEKFEGLLKAEYDLRTDGGLGRASFVLSLGNTRRLAIERDFYRSRLRPKLATASA